MRNHALSMILLGTFACQPGAYEPKNGGTREEALGQICEASLVVTGTYERTAPQPADMFGCWSVGNWRLSATVAENGCAEAPALEAEYAFEVTRDVQEIYHYRYLTDPSWDKVKMKVSSGGGGICEGGFEIFSGDGRTITRLKPALEADLTINGFGEYEVYRTSQL